MATVIAERVNVGTVYSNLDHRFDKAVAARLERPGTVASHTAWNFCGEVYKSDGGRWVDEVWIRNRMVDRVEGDDLEDVVGRANRIYGVG